MINHYRPIGSQLPYESNTVCAPRPKGLVRLLLMLGVLVIYALAL
jgi:hypothetical protein